MATKADLAAAAETAIEQSRALAVPQADGVQALALMTNDAFEDRLHMLKLGRERIARVQREYMNEDEDYGLIPNTPKPTLFKSGAEKLAQLYGLAARIESQFSAGDNTTTPPLTYDSQCFLHVGNFDGPIVAVGHGTANSWEKRYRREGDKVCPNCGKTAIIKSKAEYGGGWFCWPKKGGCNSKFEKDDPAILDQGVSAGDAMAAFDLGVTLLKMSEKRGFVDAVLRATATSGLFTQDVVEDPPEAVRAAPEQTETTVRVVQNAPVATNPEAQAAIQQSLDKAADGLTDEEFAQVVAATGGEEIVVGPSQAGEVERGGRTSGANEAQIAEVRRLASELKWGAKVLLGYVYAMFEAQEPPVPADGRIARGELSTYLDAMSAEDMGRLIQAMRQDVGLAEQREEREAADASLIEKDDPGGQLQDGRDYDSSEQ